MRTEKVSLTLDEELQTEARDVVGTRGLSSVNAALRRQLQQDRLSGLLAELERVGRPIESEVMEDVRRAWPEAGR